MKQSQPNQAADLIEALAAIEHEQWMHWSQAVAEDVPVASRDKWKRSWVGYSELADDSKEADRVCARKVVTLLRKQRLIQ